MSVEGITIENYDWSYGKKDDYSLKNVTPEKFAEAMVSLEANYLAQSRPSPLSSDGFKAITSTHEGRENYVIQFLQSGMFDETVSIEEKIAYGSQVYNSATQANEGYGAFISNEAFGASSPNTNLRVIPELSPWVIVGIEAKQVANELFTKFQDEHTNQKLSYTIQYDKTLILAPNSDEQIPFSQAQRDGTLGDLLGYRMPKYKPIVQIDSSDTVSTMPDVSNTNLKYPFVGRRSVTDSGYIVLDRPGAEGFNFFEVCGYDPRISSMGRTIRLTKILYTKKKCSSGEYTLGEATAATGNEANVANECHLVNVNFRPQFSMGGGSSYPENNVNIGGEISLLVTENNVDIVKKFHLSVRVNLNSGDVVTMVQTGGTDYIKAIYLDAEKENIANDEPLIETTMETKTETFHMAERIPLGLMIVPQAIAAFNAENKTSFFTQYIGNITAVASAMRDDFMLDQVDDSLVADFGSFIMNDKLGSFRHMDSFDLSLFIKNMHTSSEDFFLNPIKNGVRDLISNIIGQASTDTTFRFNKGSWKLLGASIDTKYLLDEAYTSGVGTGPETKDDGSGEYKNGFSVPTKSYFASIDGNKLSIISSADKKYKNKGGMIGMFVSTDVKSAPTSVYIPHTTQLYEAISPSMPGRMSLHLWVKDLIEIFGCVMFKLELKNNELNMYSAFARKS